MQKAVYWRDDLDILYILRTEGRSGLNSLMDCVNSSIQGLEDYNKKSK